MLYNLFVGIMFLGCSNSAEYMQDVQPKTLSVLLAELNNPTSGYVMVCAHRGASALYPENSLQGLQECINKGMDIVELDLQQTKDGHLIIMHDDTLGRSTTGHGNISSLTLAEIKREKLKTRAGVITSQQIPTLEEYLSVARNKLLLQIDKWVPVKSIVLKTLENQGCLEQSIFRGTYLSAKVKSLFGNYLERIIYIPVVVTNRQGAEALLVDYQKNLHTPVISFIFDKEDEPLLSVIPSLKKQYRIWFNAIQQDESCAGHGDDLAGRDLPKSYGWLVHKGANIIFSDRPFFLDSYLRKNGWR